MSNPPADASLFAIRLPHRKSSVWEYCFLLIFTCALLWPLCLGRALYWGDIVLYFAPMLRFQQSALQQGHIPLWNPMILGGQPLVGNPQMGVFYPTTPLLSLMPVWMYISLTTLLHVFLCGAFMNVYLSGWSANRWARIAGSLTYMGSECLIGRIQFPPMIFSAPYFPLLLFCIDRCLETEDANCNRTAHSPRHRRIAAYARLSLVVGLLALAAHPQMAYLILILGSIYAAARFYNTAFPLSSNLVSSLHTDSIRDLTLEKQATHWKSLVPSASRLLTAGMLGLMLASVQILPAIQVLLESPREKLTPAQANRFYLEPAHLLRLLLPRFWGHPANADFWGGGNAWEPAFFIGWLPLVFIGIACVRLRQRRKARFWIVAAFLGIWLAFGNAGGLYWIAFKIVPGLSNFHDPARFLIFTTFGFAVLTMLGWESSSKIGRIRWFGIIGVALPLWWIGKDWNTTVPHEYYLLHSRAAKIVSARNSESVFKENERNQSARLYLPAHEQFWKHYVTDGYSDYGPDDARRFQALLDTLMPNLNMEEGLESASGYEPVPLSAPASVDALGRVALRRGEPNLSRLLAVMGANTLMLPQDDRISDPRFDAADDLYNRFSVAPGQLHSRAPSLYTRAWHNQDALPRVWLVHSIRRVEGKMRLSAALAAPDFHPDEIALLQDASDLDLSASLETILPKSREKRHDAVRILSLDAHTLELKADCGLQSGFLVVGATAFPGWGAEVDFKHVPLHRVDGALMGLPLSPGKHTVIIRYKPACYRLGLFLSLLTVTFLSATMGYLQISKRTLAKSRTSV